MSDWELVQNNPPVSQERPMPSFSDWEQVQQQPPSMTPPNNETLGQAALRAPFRIGEDIYKSIWENIRSIPKYWEEAKKEIPGLGFLPYQDPGHSAKQGMAGLAEMGQNIFNTPHDIANYATNRLNLLPQNINEQIQMARMPSDTQQMINQQFGEPKYPGEKLLRGATRNIINAPTKAVIASALSPTNLHAKSIARDVVNTGNKQYAAHVKQYNNVFNKAQRTGYNDVPVDMNKLTNNFNVIEKYKTPKEYEGLANFLNNRTLSNAQKAQSDMNIIHRNLEKKSRTSSLTSEENALYDAALKAEKEIQSNMFKNQAGDVNKKLKAQYDKTTKSYRENVVPYKYNASIQAYKNQEMLAHELVNSLSGGEFAAKKGYKHPYIGIRKSLKPLLSAGVLGGLGYGAYNTAFGTENINPYNK